MNHYEMIASVTAQGEAVQKQSLDKKQFLKEFGAWSYALLISLLPFFIVFILFTGPKNNFAFLELFHDNALYYVCVTMSALSLYTYKMINWVRGLHVIILVVGMAVYIFSISEVPIPLFVEYGYDHRKLIFVFFLVSILVGFSTLLYSSIKRGE